MRCLIVLRAFPAILALRARGWRRIPHLFLFSALWSFASSETAAAFVSFYTNETEREEAISGTIEDIPFTASNVAQADEVASAPGQNQNLGVNSLTFGKINTGLPASFVFEALESGATFTFDDDENAGNLPYFDNALSVGDINK